MPLGYSAHCEVRHSTAKNFHLKPQYLNDTTSDTHSQLQVKMLQKSFGRRVAEEQIKKLVADLF